MLPENNNCIDADTHFRDDDRHYEDSELDAMDRAWVREQQRRDDEADAAAAEIAMADVSAELAADAGESVSAVIARGNQAIMDQVAAMLGKKVG